uniref:EGF-like domain-containing protein n=1 Tax=Trichuris muris TaxID=70415 RepID=A0A5S6QRG0_TRIMR
MLLFLCCWGVVLGVAAGEYANGAPCEIQHSMRPSLAEHGPPQQSAPPYLFTVLDADWNPVKEYSDKSYTIRLSGTTYFRGFLIQARLATTQGTVIGHLRAGEFVEDGSWSYYGIRFQRCITQRNNSITHTDNRMKFVIEATWKIEYGVGPIQFVITVLKEHDVYWAFWLPKTGLIFPSANSKSRSRLFWSSASKLSGQSVANSTADATTTTTTMQTTSNVLISETVTPAYTAVVKVEGRNETSRAKLQQGELPSKRDWCKDQPCQNGGTCMNTLNVDRFECTCPLGWIGTLCDKKDFCTKHQCQYGLCLNKEDGYVCDCDPGFGGEFCDTECPNSLCANGGVCVIKNGKPKCHCQPDYTGDKCAIKIDQCSPNPCLNKGVCKNVPKSYVCQCPLGYMGPTCHRPCQDVYGSCGFWGEQEKCETMRPATDFYDINCAVTCGQCDYSNKTVKTADTLPPILEPFLWIIGTWRVEYGRNLSFPVNLAESNRGYVEELTISNQRVLMFNMPYLNFSVKTISRSNPKNQHTSLGFITLKPASSPIEVAIISTSNQGITTIEEGEMNGTNMKIETKYAVAITRGPHIPIKTTRHFRLSGNYLEETTQITRKDGSFDYFTKYFVKTKTFNI